MEAGRSGMQGWSLATQWVSGLPWLHEILPKIKSEKENPTFDSLHVGNEKQDQMGPLFVNARTAAIK